MKNKKGFTLIELLAVIIILGVLMATAVVGVTRYIQDSRKSTYANSALSFISGVSPAVNSGQIDATQVGTLYLVPVGNDETKTCTKLEKGGVSPFHKTWTYAYVGVVYDNQDRDYYFVSRDGANHGVNFTDNKELQDKGGKLIVTGSELTNVAELAANYGTSATFFVGSTTPPTGAINGSAELRTLAGKVTNSTVSYVTFVGTADCGN